jgi:hypothetical protein
MIDIKHPIEESELSCRTNYRVETTRHRIQTYVSSVNHIVGSAWCQTLLKQPQNHLFINFCDLQTSQLNAANALSGALVYLSEKDHGFHQGSGRALCQLQDA